MSKRARNKRCIGVSHETISHCCASCSFKTTSLTGLKLHLKIKHKKKPTSENKRENREICAICKESFKDIKEIVKQVKRAHGER